MSIIGFLEKSRDKCNKHSPVGRKILRAIDRTICLLYTLKHRFERF